MLVWTSPVNIDPQTVQPLIHGINPLKISSLGRDLHTSFTCYQHRDSSTYIGRNTISYLVFCKPRPQQSNEVGWDLRLDWTKLNKILVGGYSVGRAKVERTEQLKGTPLGLPAGSGSASVSSLHKLRNPKTIVRKLDTRKLKVTSKY